jgi:organic radical activating enzyme
MKYVDADKGLKVFDIKFDVTTAGPSPNDNKRIELFLLGCDKAMRGDACEGCFNRRLWDSNLAEFSCDIESLANWIIERTPENERYITIGGAEPTMQIDYLIPFCKMLKNAGFHIMIYTYRELLKEFKISNKEYNVPYRIDTTKWIALLETIDMIVDGPFVQELKLYKEDYNDGFLSSIGSGNQRIWDINYFRKYKKLRGYAMKDLSNIDLGFDNSLIYYVKLGSKQREVLDINA